jgi:serine/threonine protein kinase
VPKTERTQQLEVNMEGSGSQRAHIARGTILGENYEVFDCLGEGSRGTVYLCTDRRIAKSRVAVKVMWISRRELAADPSLIERFQNEANICDGVRHANVVKSYEYFSGEGFFAYSMEHVEGGSLADLLVRQEVVPTVRIVRLLMQACRGLAAVHERGIVHRDLKPENFLLTPAGDLKIADFGIARISEGRKLTAQGALLGTIDYLSPEYLRDGSLDLRSDLYALGLVAYELLTGRKPYEPDENLVQSLRRRLTQDPTPPHLISKRCPQALSLIVTKALSRDPGARYQSAREMLTDLDSLDKNEQVSWFADDHAETPARKKHRRAVRIPIAQATERFGSSSPEAASTWHVLILLIAVTVGAAYVRLNHKSLFSSTIASTNVDTHPRARVPASPGAGSRLTGAGESSLNLDGSASARRSASPQ